MERRFAFVAEGDVFMTMAFNPAGDEEAPPETLQMIIAGMASNPKIIEFGPTQSITEGWTHDGTNFIPPK